MGKNQRERKAREQEKKHLSELSRLAVESTARILQKPTAAVRATLLSIRHEGMFDNVDKMIVVMCYNTAVDAMSSLYEVMAANDITASSETDEDSE